MRILGQAQARVYGHTGSNKYAVLFGSSGFSLDEFRSNLKTLKPLFEAGWSVVAFDYPDNSTFLKTRLAIAKWNHSDIQVAAPVMDFTGFGHCVYNAVAMNDPTAEICFIGNSMGAGTMAPDLPAIRKQKPISAIWISPTEVFLPDIKKIASSAESVGRNWHLSAA